MNQITKNYLYNVAYKFFILLVPLITIPYLARVLGPTNLGIYSYITSVSNIISIITLLGVFNYGTRQIAYERQNKLKMSQTFCEIMMIRFFMIIVGSVIYFIIAFYLQKYTCFFLKYYWWMLACYLDCTWLYIGVEDMKPAVVKNFFAKIIGILCIFLFVKTKEDIGRYIFISGVAMLIANISAYSKLNQYIVAVKIYKSNIIKHVKGSILLFLPTIASLIYLQVDKVMLEAITLQTSQVSFYDNAEKIITIPLMLITALSTVMMPRIANEFSCGNFNQIEELVLRSARTTLFLSFPMSFGICAISSGFIPWYLGNEFKPVIIALYYLFPIIISNSLETVSGQQYFTGTNRVNVLTLSYSITAVLNVVLNYLLIPIFGFKGAAIATLCSSYLAVSIQLLIMSREINLWKLLPFFIKYFMMSVIMFGVIFLTTHNMESTIVNTFIQILIGGTCYIVEALLVKEEVLMKIIKQKTII